MKTLKLVSAPKAQWLLPFTSWQNEVQDANVKLVMTCDTPATARLIADLCNEEAEKINE